MSRRGRPASIVGLDLGDSAAGGIPVRCTLTRHHAGKCDDAAVPPREAIRCERIVRYVPRESDVKSIKSREEHMQATRQEEAAAEEREEIAAGGEGFAVPDAQSPEDIAAAFATLPENGITIVHGALRVQDFERACETAGHVGPCSSHGIRDVEVGDGPVHNREREAYPAAPGERCGAMHPEHGACFRRTGHAAYSTWHQSPDEMGRSDVSWKPPAPSLVGATLEEVPPDAPAPITADLVTAFMDAGTEHEMYVAGLAEAKRILTAARSRLARHIHATRPKGQRVALVQVGGVWYQAVPPRKKRGETEATGEWGLVEVRT